MTTTISPGQSGILLDIRIKAGSVLYDPIPVPVFEIKDANGFQQGSGFYHANRLGEGHYNAGFWAMAASPSGALGSWTINWSVLGSTKSETFTAALPTLSITGDTLGDIATIYDHIRIDIGDINGDIFEESVLERYVRKSVMRLNRKLGISAARARPTGVTPGGLGTPASIPAITVDFDQGTISPDNDEMKDLVILQSEVLITSAELSILRRASSQNASQSAAELWTATSGMTSGGASEGISVRNPDGAAFDNKSRATSWNTNKVRLFLAEQASREKELADGIKQMKMWFAGSYGKVIY